MMLLWKKLFSKTRNHSKKNGVVLHLLTSLPCVAGGRRPSPRLAHPGCGSSPSWGKAWRESGPAWIRGWERRMHLAAFR